MKDNDISKLLPDWTLTYVLSENGGEKVYQAEKETASQTKYSLVRAFYIPCTDERLEDFKKDFPDEEVLRRYTAKKLAECKKEFTFFRNLNSKSGWLSLKESYDISDTSESTALCAARFGAAQRLSEFIDENGFTLGAILKMGIDVCHGLEHISKGEILHGSLTPDIIYVDDNCRFRIGKIDLHISERRNPDELSSEALAFAAPYAPKEQLSYSSDTYAVGLMMYYFLNGRKLPFEDELGYDEAIKKRLSGVEIPKPLHSFAKVTEIVLRACSAEKEERYQTPHQMRKELEEVYVRLQKEIEEKKIKERAEKKKLTESTDINAENETDISAVREHKKSQSELINEKKKKEKKIIVLGFAGFIAVLAALWVFVPKILKAATYKDIGEHKIILASEYYKKTNRAGEFAFNYEYDGKAKEPKIVIDGLENLVEGRDYSVEYENNVEVGKATVKVTGKGKFFGTKTKTFTVKMKSPGAIERFDASDITRDSVTLSWSKAEDAERYVIYRFKENENDWGGRDYMVDASQLSITLTGLKPDTHYSFRIRGAVFPEDGDEVKGESTVVEFKTKP